MAPGMLYANSKITSQDLSAEDFNHWYNDIHVPDVLKTSGVKTAFRYESLDPSAELPYLALYPLKDLDFCNTDESKNIPLGHDMLPGPSHLISDSAYMDVRQYKHLQTYEGLGGKGTEAGPAKFVVAAAASPIENGDEDFDAWYRKEHLYELSKCTGYRRTRRYALVEAVQMGSTGEQKKVAEMPKYIAFHEFDGDSLPNEQLAKTAETEWAQKVWTPAPKKEMGAYKLLSAQGDVKAKL